MLRDIEPETILFLSKLKRLLVETDAENALTIQKDDSRLPLVRISVDGKEQNSSISYSDEFLFFTQCFIKPPAINPQIRRDINERDISIVFPLNDDSESAGKVFAYLPVSADTGLPFLINADFLLPSSREAIKENEPWNLWLRDRVADTFVEAFEDWLDIKDYRTLVYRFIPLKAHKVFFEPVVTSILDKLKDREIVLTEPEGLKRKPEETRTAYKNFRSLLSTKSYPRALLDTPLVLDELMAYENQLERIGVKPLTLGLVKECFQDKQWIMEHDLDWLLACYQYFSTPRFENIDLAGCPIVPIGTEGEINWSSDTEQPIYFECDQECERILGEVPACARVPLAFLHRSFYERIKADNAITDWMTKVLKVYDFSDQNYAVDVLNWLQDHFRKISQSELVLATGFLSQFANTDIDFKNIPVLLADGRRMLLSEAKAERGGQVVTTPAALDPNTGWQNLFATQADRGHFVSLANIYVTATESPDLLLRLENFWTKMKITDCPMPLKRHVSADDKNISEYENDCCLTVYYSSTRATWIKNYAPLQSFTNNYESVNVDNVLNRSKSIVLWLSKQQEYPPWQYASVEWFYYSSRSKIYDSEFLHSLKMNSWLATTKGFVRPTEAFLPAANVKEVLGDSVPYFEGNLLPIQSNYWALEPTSLPPSLFPFLISSPRARLDLESLRTRFIAISIRSSFLLRLLTDSGEIS